MLAVTAVTANIIRDMLSFNLVTNNTKTELDDHPQKVLPLL